MPVNLCWLEKLSPLHYLVPVLVATAAVFLALFGRAGLPKTLATKPRLPLAAPLVVRVDRDVLYVSTVVVEVETKP